MTLVSPLPLLLLLLAIPVVLAFLRRPPPRRRIVSSLLLSRALAQAPARRRRPPLRELIALALMLLALMAAVTGVAFRPDPPPRGLVVLMDTSAAAALRRDSDLVALDKALEARPGAPVTLVSTAPPQLLRAGATDHIEIKALAAALPTEGTDGDLSLLLTRTCSGDRPPQLLALVDAPLQVSLDDLGCAATVPPAPVRDNTGLTEMSLRRADGLGLVEVHLETSRPAAVLLTSDGQPVGEVNVDGSALVRLDLPGAAQLTATVAEGGNWTGDDTATAAIPASPQVQALLLTASMESFAAAALRAHPGVTLTVSDTVPEDGEWDLVIAEVDVPTLPTAPHVVVLGTDPATLGVRPGPTVVRPEVSVDQPQDPLLQYVDTRSLYLGEARTLQPLTNSTVLLSCPQGPLAVLTPTAKGEVLILGFGLDDTDLVLRTSFINFVANIVEWARPSPAVGANGQGVLSAAESMATPLDTRSASADPRPAISTAAAALAALVLLFAEWLMQIWWREP